MNRWDITTNFNDGWFAKFIENFSPDQRLQGYYNHNYHAKVGDQEIIVRIPITNRISMDIMILNENVVLQFLESQNFPAPRLLYTGTLGSIHSRLPGQSFHNLYPRSTEFPAWVANNLADQMKQLHSLPISRFISCHPLFQKSPNSSHFFDFILNFTKEIYKKYQKYRSSFDLLGIPSDPFEIFDSNPAFSSLSPRKFVLCHCDIHRKNLIIQDQTLGILDWELALVGDPAYDIAIHFHKMRYPPKSESEFLQSYLNTTEISSFYNDVQKYRAIEQVKSAIVDFIRYSGDFKSKIEYIAQEEIANHYLGKLKRAWKFWQLDPIDFPSVQKTIHVLNTTL